MDAFPKYPKDLSDEESGWLEDIRQPDPGQRTKCCARCQRGPIPRQFPCGKLLNCACHNRENT